MIEILKYAVMLLIYLIMYLSVGTIILRIIKKEYSFILAMIIGFFGYHSLFQIVALPLIFLKGSLTTVTNIWLVVMAIVFIGMLFCLKTWKESIKWQAYEIQLSGIYLFAAIICVALQLYFVVTHHIVDADSGFYIGTANTAIYSNTMHVFDPFTGKQRSILDLRYALGTFSIHSSVMSKIFKVAVVQEMRVVTASVNVILSNLVIAHFGRILFKFNKEKGAAIMVILGVAINMVNYSIYTTSWFLMARAYEGKAFCGNVILPMLFAVCLMIVNDYREKSNWIMLFLITFSCNTISMSSMLTVPAVLTGMLLLSAVRVRNKDIFLRYLICMIPCVIIVGMYFLSTVGILKIYT